MFKYEVIIKNNLGKEAKRNYDKFLGVYKIYILTEEEKILKFSFFSEKYPLDRIRLESHLKGIEVISFMRVN